MISVRSLSVRIYLLKTVTIAKEFAACERKPISYAMHAKALFFSNQPGSIVSALPSLFAVELIASHKRD
jgi:hypothetical protein